MKYLLTLALSSALIMPVMAQDEGTPDPVPAPQAEQAETLDQVDQDREAYVALQNSIDSITKDLNAENKHHFNQIYGAYAIVNTVRTVQGEVGNAIEKCSENNPDMKADLNNRFATWQGAVNPTIDESMAKINNMIAVQEYAEKTQFDAVMKGVEDTRIETQNKIKKIPVTTPEACTYLMTKMDDTQETMVNLLRQTLASYPIPEKGHSDKK